jgi:tetratricopeptide (TPR) repeat protein
LIPYPGGWGARLGLYDRGIALDPDFAPLHDARTEQLIRVGRIQEAVQSARRAVALDPLSADYRDSLIRALATAGNLHAAREELDREERIWPAARRSRLGRYAFELRYGDPRIALRFQDQPDLFDFANPPTDREFAAFLRARLAPTRANIDAAVAAFMPSYPRWTAGLIQTLGQFGRVDQAYRLFGPPAAMTRLSGASDVLFRPPMASIRRDRRFMTLAARIGLLRYWRDSGVWPDFCLDPGLPYNCRAEAAKLPEPRGP